MQFSILKNISPAAFDEYIAHVGGSFLQSSNWGEWQISAKDHAQREVYRYTVMQKDDVVLAVQIISTKLFKSNYFLYAPYGPVWDKERIPENELMTIMEVLALQIKKDHPKAVFIRLEPKGKLLSNNIRTLHGYRISSTPHIQPGKTIVIDLTETPEVLLSKMHQKTRYNIKVAQRYGVQVSHTDINLEEALSLIVQTAKRQGFYTHPLAYYQNLTTFLSNQNATVSAKVYTARYNNELLTSAIIIDFAGTRTYLFGGSNDTQRNVMAPYLLHWQAILDAKANGMTTYDWYGAEAANGDTPGFTKFKQNFGGEILEFSKAIDVIFKPLPYFAYTLARKANRWIKHRSI